MSDVILEVEMYTAGKNFMDFLMWKRFLFDISKNGGEKMNEYPFWIDEEL